MKTEIQRMCGFKSQSSIATICEAIAIRRRDLFFDKGHWSFRSKRSGARRSLKSKLAEL